jgi:hypothetical protein
MDQRLSVNARKYRVRTWGNAYITNTYTMHTILAKRSSRLLRSTGSLTEDALFNNDIRLLCYGGISQIPGSSFQQEIASPLPPVLSRLLVVEEVVRACGEIILFKRHSLALETIRILRRTGSVSNYEDY